MNMNRNTFLRNIVLGIAATILPKILQPTLPEVCEEEMVDIPIRLEYVTYNYVGGIDPYQKVEAKYDPQEHKIWILKLPKSAADKFVAEYQSRTS